jgi:hypothetical protein
MSGDDKKKGDELLKENVELVEIILTDPQSEDVIKLGDTPPSIPIPPKEDEKKK